MVSGRPPHPLLLRWEALPARLQIAVAFPIVVALLFLLHVTLLFQPLGRGLAYGVFWGVPATAMIVLATRNEAAKRRGAAPPEG